MGGTNAPGATDSASAGDVPAISEPHRRFLSNLARRTMRDKLLDRPIYEPGYVPQALVPLETEVVIRLRRGGFLLDAGVGGPLPVAHATRNAALAAVTPMIESGEMTLDLLNHVLVEIEVVGPARPIEIDTDWTQPRAIDPFIEPGVHGFVFRSGELQRRFCPSEIFTSDIVVADALRAIAQQLKPLQTHIQDVKLMRFRTAHWYEGAGGREIVSLHRGLTVVPPEDVTAKNLDDAVTRLAEYMIYRQLPSGLFSYQYEPALDRYSPESNWVRQAGAVSAMAYHASHAGRSASIAAADMGVRFMLTGLVDIPGADNAAFIATPDQHNKLGVTALVCMALAYHPDASRYADTREKLISGMLWLQRPSGMFVTAFPPAEEIRAQEYFPGEALLAMALHYDLSPSAEVLDAFDRSINFYRGFFRNSPGPAFIPWQVQAYALMARKSRRGDYIDYVFELTDWLAEKQLDRSNCAWPEMWGGIAAYQDNRAGVATAAYLEGFAEALMLARRIGDTRRVERYEKVVRLAARFVMQLQVRPEEAYFIRSPQDAIDGIRTSPSLYLLRIDHCQHALIGLMKAREALFSNTD